MRNKRKVETRKIKMENRKWSIEAKGQLCTLFVVFK